MNPFLSIKQTYLWVYRSSPDEQIDSISVNVWIVVQLKTSVNKNVWIKYVAEIKINIT